MTRLHLVGTFDERWTASTARRACSPRAVAWTQTSITACPGDVTSRDHAYTGDTLTVSAPGEA